jgi:hypothetical protein
MDRSYSVSPAAKFNSSSFVARNANLAWTISRYDAGPLPGFCGSDGALGLDIKISKNRILKNINSLYILCIARRINRGI